MTVTMHILMIVALLLIVASLIVDLLEKLKRLKERAVLKWVAEGTQGVSNEGAQPLKYVKVEPRRQQSNEKQKLLEERRERIRVLKHLGYVPVDVETKECLCTTAAECPRGKRPGEKKCTRDELKEWGTRYAYVGTAKTKEEIEEELETGKPNAT